MLIRPVDYFLVVWFVLAAASTLQRFDVIWKALRLGKWLIHCHIGHHTTNNNVEMNGGGGLMMIIDVRPVAS